MAGPVPRREWWAALSALSPFKVWLRQYSQNTNKKSGIPGHYNLKRREQAITATKGEIISASVAPQPIDLGSDCPRCHPWTRYEAYHLVPIAFVPGWNPVSVLKNPWNFMDMSIQNIKTCHPSFSFLPNSLSGWAEEILLGVSFNLDHTSHLPRWFCATSKTLYIDSSFCLAVGLPCSNWPSNCEGRTFLLDEVVDALYILDKVTALGHGKNRCCKIWQLLQYGKTNCSGYS